VQATAKSPNVAQAGGIMMLSLFLSRVLGIARDTAMTATFGINHQTDAYRLAFQIPDLLFFLIAGGALSSAFIPVFSEYYHTGREEEAWKIFSVVTTVMSAIVLVFIVGAWIFALPLTHLIAPYHQADDIRELIARMSRIVLPGQFAFLIGGLMIGTLYARQKFFVPGMAPNFYNLGIIFGALVLSHLFTPRIIGMSWGAVTGAVVGSLLIPLWAVRKLGSRFEISFDVRRPGVKKVFILMLPVVLGLSLPGVYGMIMQALGSGFSHGTNTALDLSNKLMQAPLGIFGQSLALAVFPALTQFYAQERMDMFRNQLAGTLRTVIYITLPVTAIMLVLAPEIVTIFFSYGKSAGSANIGMVADCLRMFGIGVAAWCLHPVLMRGFFAVQNTVTPIVVGTIATALFIGLVFALQAVGLSYLSLPLASSLSAIVLVLLLLVLVVPKSGGLDVAGIAATFGKGLVAAAVMAAILWIGHALVPNASGWKHNAMAAVKVLGFGLVGAWAYYYVTKLLRMPEADRVDRGLARWSAKKPNSASPA
jgi:putative peptidoglycan lipid II flippase